jgi:hypothetical protein
VTAGDLLLVATIWLALACFVAGQEGQRLAVLTSRAPAWAWPIWCAGAALCALHMILALDLRYGWDHARAVAATADQTAAVYGLRWPGSIYVNYVFLAVWIGEAAWWRLDAGSFLFRRPGVTVLVRAFYLIVLVNAAIVFARPVHRLAGVGLIVALALVWRRRSG